MEPAVYLFDRRCELAVALAQPVDEQRGNVRLDTVISISNLRVQFKVEKSLQKDPNTAEISVTNLAESTRSRMQDVGARVFLRAGYLQTVQQIFTGDAISVEHVREGADWVTKIQAGDGHRGLTHGRVSQSFPPGTLVKDCVGLIGKASGLDISNLVNGKALGDLAGQQFVNGYTAHGPAGVELDKVLRGAGYEWSVQDGRVVALKPGQTGLERAIVLGPESGLIGSPEYVASKKRPASTKTGKPAKGKPPIIKFKALLSGDIMPGRRIEFESARHEGVHRVLKVTHTGDTAGGGWYSEGEAEAVEDKRVAAGGLSSRAGAENLYREFLTKNGAGLAAKYGQDLLNKRLSVFHDWFVEAADERRFPTDGEIADIMTEGRVP